MVSSFIQVPLRVVGPVSIKGSEFTGEARLPIATFETTLWPSLSRGAKLTRAIGGVTVEILDDGMARSVILEAISLADAIKVKDFVATNLDRLQAEVIKSSNYAKLTSTHIELVGKLIYARFAFITGDASGHNMVTKASDYLMKYLIQEFPELKYLSVSGNMCVDKKVSAINGILGRGKRLAMEAVILRDICLDILKTTPEKIVELNIKKNLIGSKLAGSIRSANAHFANILLGVYLATGQDSANIVEGSQGIVHAEMSGEDLYISMSIPNVIVGTIGNGKVQENLEIMGCANDARKLAIVTAAACFAGEMSLMAALTNQGELMESHTRFERTKEGV